MKTLLLVFTSFLLLSGCNSYDFSRRAVQQGNLLPAKKIQRLKIGMSKEDAAILMGTSLLSPTFNNDRWDYAFTWRKGNGPTTVKNLRLHFKNGALSRIEHNP